MKEPQLKKSVSSLTALTVLVGTVIGAGVFFKPAAVFTASGAPGVGLLAWLIAGIITIAGGLTVAEIGTIYSQTGGLMVYMEEVYGKFWGFLAGWAQMVVYFPANFAALAIIFAAQVISLFGLSSGLTVPIAIGTALFIALMNFMGTQYGGWIQTAATFLKLIPLLVIIVAGLLYPGGGSTQLLPFAAADRPFMTAISSALVATLFAYDGWINVGALAGEMKNPGKTLPRVIVGGLSIVMAVYLAINVAYLFVVDSAVLAATETPAAAVATQLFPGIGGKLITIGILISVFGAMNGYFLSGMRIPYVLAQRGMLPFSGWFGHVHAKTNIPRNGGIFILFVSVMMMLTGSFNQLTDLIVFVIWIFSTMTFLAVLLLRKRAPELNRPYKVPLYPFIPLVAMAGGVFILTSILLTQPLNALLGIVLTLSGVPFFLSGKKHKKISYISEDS
ncbi:APC family permease [Atopococcus tabaci]|uniref:APC family permease n=1 Tax=Atopococcus tabaci TaxID=269774 RepID=UPI0024097D6B|nr:amino acid permease [Atopococcus tabaci]